MNGISSFVFSVLDEKCRGTIKRELARWKNIKISPWKGLDQWAHGGLMGIFVPCLPRVASEAGWALGKARVSKFTQEEVQVGTDWQVPGCNLIPSPHHEDRPVPSKWLCLL